MDFILNYESIGKNENLKRDSEIDAYSGWILGEVRIHVHRGRGGTSPICLCSTVELHCSVLHYAPLHCSAILCPCHHLVIGEKCEGLRWAVLVSYLHNYLSTHLTTSGQSHGVHWPLPDALGVYLYRALA